MDGRCGLFSIREEADVFDEGIYFDLGEVIYGRAVGAAVEIQVFNKMGRIVSLKINLASGSLHVIESHALDMASFIFVSIAVAVSSLRNIHTDEADGHLIAEMFEVQFANPGPI